MNKRKAMLAVLCMAGVATGAVALAGCTKTNDENKTHTEHTWADGWSQSEDGKTHYHKCTAEGCNAVNGTADHTWDNGTDVSDASCTSAKTVKYKCTVCNYEKQAEAVGDPLGHDWGEWEITAENTPTADKDGKATRACKRDGCNAVNEEQVTVPKLLTDGKITPQYNGWVKDNTATCEEGGTATYEFVDAIKQIHLTFTGATPALGHEWNEELSHDDNNHFYTCARNPEHKNPDGNEAHVKKTSPAIIFNKETGKWENIVVTACETAGCNYSDKAKGQGEDLTDGTGATLTGATDGNGTVATPYVLTASDTKEYTVEIPANTVVSCRFTKLSAMGVYAVALNDDGEGALKVIYGDRVESITAGERAKSDPYFGERGGSLDFALTSADGAAVTATFRFFDNDNYSENGTPVAVEVGTEYTDTVPAETYIKHTFAPATDGVYKFVVTGGDVMVEDGKDVVNGGAEFSEPLYNGKTYTITVSTDFDRSAGTVSFIITREGDIAEPAPGTVKNPIEITEAGDYTVEIEQGTYFAYGKNYTFTPAVSGLYVFADATTDKAIYTLYSDREYSETLATSMSFELKENSDGKEYFYLECELVAGTTYYLSVGSSENKAQTYTMNIALHEHTFNTDEWAKDDRSHWHAATCGHDDVKNDEANHTFNAQDICEVCGKEKVKFNATITVSNLTGVTVTAKLADGTVVASGETASGVVTLSLAPDDYVLELTGLPETHGCLNVPMNVSVVDKAVSFTAPVYEKETFSVTVTMPDGTTGAEGVEVTFKNSVSGTHTATTGADGVASVTAIPPLLKQGNNISIGSYAVTFGYPENFDYTYSGSAINLTSSKKTAEVTLINAVTYTFKLTDAEGVALGAGISITVNGATVITDTNGVATLKTSAEVHSITLSDSWVTGTKTTEEAGEINVICHKVINPIDGSTAGNAPVIQTGNSTYHATNNQNSYLKFVATEAGKYTISINDITTTDNYLYSVYLNGTNSRTDKFINAGSLSSRVTVDDKYELVAEKETVNGKQLLRTITITLGEGEFVIFSSCYEGYLNVSVTKVTE